MISVGEQNLHAELFGKIPLGQPFYGRLRPDRHEDGRPDGTVRRMKQAGARTGLRTFGHYFKEGLGQFRL